MSQAQSSHSPHAVGLISNGGSQRYLLEAESTTGFTAWKLDDGTILVSQAAQVSLQRSNSISFWSCAGFQDTTPAGKIISFDCHGNALTKLNVTGLTELRLLDCSFNKLTKLPLGGLLELEALDADDNRLTSLDVHQLHALRVLNCANNRLKRLDVSKLGRLQILDCSGNQIPAINVDDCTALRDAKT